MIISDISHIEVATEDNNIQGGFAFADAFAGASASGPNYAATFTSTSTGAFVSSFFFFGSSANSSSSSSSAAA